MRTYSIKAFTIHFATINTNINSSVLNIIRDLQYTLLLLILNRIQFAQELNQNLQYTLLLLILREI